MFPIFPWRLSGPEPLSEPIMAYYKLFSWKHISMEFWSRHSNFDIRKLHTPYWKQFWSIKIAFNKAYAKWRYFCLFLDVLIWQGWLKLTATQFHHSDVMMSAMTSQITSLTFLLNRLFRRRSKKTLKLRVTGLCARNSPMIGEFPA